MTTLAEIQADRHKWKKITGTGTAPYNPARYELKEKYKEEQRKQLKKATTPTTTKRVGKSTTTTPTKTDIVTPIRKGLSSAVGKKARGEAAAAKVFDTDRARKARTDKAIAGLYSRAGQARGDRAREKVYSGARKGSDPEEVARRIDLRKENAIREAARKRETAPVKMKLSAGQVYDKPIGPQYIRPLGDLLMQKTGGKVSRRKGGTVSRNSGGKVWKGGNFEVSQWYDKIKT